MSAIELRDVGVTHEDRVVLEDVRLTVPDGVITALLGPSGSGKTSLLRVVAGLSPPTTGTVLIGGEDATHHQPNERGLAYVPQGAPLQGHRDVGQNLAFPLQVKGVGRRAATEEAEQRGTRFGLGRLLRRRPKQLSTGEQAAVGIARGMMSPPRALLLDEPVPHLDPRRRAEVLARIAAFQGQHGTTVLMATNDVRVAEVLAHRVAVIDRRTVVRDGTLDDVRSAPGTVVAADLVAPAPMHWLPGVLGPGPRPPESSIETGAGTVTVQDGALRGRSGPVLLGIGTRDGVLAPTGTGSLTGRVTRIATTGPRRLVSIATAAGPLTVDSDDDRWLPEQGQPVDVDVRRAHVADDRGDVVAVVG